MDELDKKIENNFKEWEKKIEEIKNDRKFEELEKKEKDLKEGQGDASESNITNKRMIEFMERKEREDRKNNIIIKGLAVNEMGENLRIR